MKIIDYDPNSRIPPLMERDIKNKIIISNMRASSTTFISFMKFDDGGFLHFYGSDTALQDDWLHQWRDDYNSSKMVIELITKEYNWVESMNWSVRYVIIESKKDLINYIELQGIQGYSIAKELIAYWRKLCEQ